MISPRRLAKLIGTAVVVSVVGAMVVLSLPPRAGGPGASNTPEITAVALESAVPSPDISPESTPTAAGSERPAPSPTPSPAASASPPATIPPSPDPSDQAVLQRSDAFWVTWIDRPEPMYDFEFATVEDATQQADLIVRGRVTNAYIGEYWRFRPEWQPRPHDYLTISIDEVIKGEPVSRTSGAVELEIGFGDQNLIDDVSTRLPTEESLWFLMYEANFSYRTLEPQRSSPLAPYAYFLPNPLQGFVRNIDGTVRVLQPEWTANAYRGQFPVPLEGTSFEALLEQVRAIAEMAPGTEPSGPE